MFDLATARAELGIVGAAQDAALTRLLDTALDIVEKYLDRFLLLSRETVAFRELNADKLWMPRYPLQTVHAINGQPVSGDFAVHYSNGWIRGPFDADYNTIEYTAGYDPLPSDLEYALWLVFHNLWANANQQTGGPGSGGGGAVVTGGLKSINITGVGSLSYDSGGASAGGGASSGAQSGLLALIPAQALAILDPYRRHSV